MMAKPVRAETAMHTCSIQCQVTLVEREAVKEDHGEKRRMPSGMNTANWMGGRSHSMCTLVVTTVVSV